MHPFIIDAQGTCLLTWARPQRLRIQNRMPKSPATSPARRRNPRRHLEYDANKTGQQLLPPERYATGIRNGEDWD